MDIESYLHINPSHAYVMVSMGKSGILVTIEDDTGEVLFSSQAMGIAAANAGLLEQIA